MKIECGLSSGDALVPLKSVDVAVRMTHCVAEIEVAQRYKNCETKPIEAVYSFPLPESSAVCKFEIEIDGKKIVGRVAKREEAKEEYDAALKRGDGAYMVGQDRPNVFTANVGNLLPDQEAVIRLSYAIELVQAGDSIRLALPSTISPRYIDDKTAAKEASDKLAHLNPPRVGKAPYTLSLRVDSECASDIREIACATHPIKVSVTGNKAVVELCGNDIQLDQDIVINYKLAKPHEASATVARDGDKKIVAVSLYPEMKQLQRQPCEFIFLLDKSGSMGGVTISGSPLRCAKEAMLALVAKLRDQDKFNIIAFATTHAPLFDKSVKAISGNKQQARAWLERLNNLDVGSGTEVLPPLQQALETTAGGLPRIVAVITDGQIGGEDECSKLVATHKDCHVFTFGIGCGPNTLTLSALARAGRGRAEFIGRGEDVEAKVTKQLACIASSFLKNVRIDWGNLKTDLVVPESAPVMFDGEKLTLYARVIGGDARSISVLADSDAGPLCFSANIDLEKATQDRAIPVLFARRAIQEIEEHVDYTGLKEKEKQAVLDLSLHYQIMSTQASFIAVEERAPETQGDKAQTRIVPVALTNDWGMEREVKTGGGVFGVSGPMGSQGSQGSRGFCRFASVSGVPNAFPLAINSPLDRVYLLPISSSRYDTEVYDPASPNSRQTFFWRPISQAFQVGGKIKGLGDTNMNQSNMLDYPLELSVVGFGFYLEDGISEADRAALLNGAVFQFVFSGNRPYFTQPLLMFPNFQGQTESIEATSETLARVINGKRTECTPLGSIYPLPWPSDLEALRIKPGETFGVNVIWNEPPKVSRPIRMMAVVYGFEWLPR